MRKLVLVALATLTLAACGETPEERDQRQDKSCQHYGAKPGTPEYIQCRATIHVAEVMQKRADDAQASASIAQGMAIGMAASAGRR